MSETDIGLSELPEGWIWTTVGSIGLVASGKTPKGINDLDSEGEIPFYKVNDMNKLGNEKFMRAAEIALDDGEIERLGIHVRRQGTVIFPKAGGAIATNKKRILSCPSAYDLNIMGVLPYIIPTDFFYQWLSSVDLAALSYGSNVPQINHKDIDPLPFPLPPLPEQHRIVAKIEELFTKLDAGINELRKAQSQLKRYRQSVLKAAFEGKLTEAWRTEHQEETEPASVLLECILKVRRERWEIEQLEQMKAKGKIPKDDKWKMKYKEPVAPDVSNLPELPYGWKWTTVGSIGLVASGKTPKGINDLDSEGEIPFYKVNDMNKLGNEKFMRAAEIALDDGEIEGLGIHVRRQGTVIFPKAGGAIATNKKRILSCPSAYDLNIMGVLPYIIPTDFFYQWLSLIDLAALSYGSNVPQINHKDIDPLPFPLPPLSEQQAIVSEVESRLSVADEVEKTITVELKRAEQLRQSILKKAFSGKLASQDPNDEPASILLERIRAEKSQHSQGQLRLKLA